MQQKDLAFGNIESSDIKDIALQYQDYVVKMRREFHEYPEVSGREFHTREVLCRELNDMGVPYRLLDGTGIVAVIAGEKPGKTRLLRADIDALPVMEEMENLKKKRDVISGIPGVSHACGHDAHMAVLLGTMRVLLKVSDRIEGTVYCCFEEGEETNCGIETMMKALEEVTIDECFALHVLAGLDSGKINVVPGPRMAGCLGIGIYLHGRSGHGSRPDQAISPIIPMAHIITQYNSAFMNQLNVGETVTLGLGKVVSGEATNVIPDQAYLGGTARFFDPQEGRKALAIINRIAENTAESHNCTVTYESRHCISPDAVVNDANVATRVQKGITAVCGEEVLGDCERWYASETFSFYLKKCPGALGFLGIRNEEYGSGAPHHNGKFDIDESNLYLGVCAEAAFVLL
ncbi:MAG: amidohydrolase [Clostridiales bacterium]|nr:amidohydrolase [Clostridiales bacterium]